MEQIEKIVNTVLGYVEQFDNALEILTLVCLMVLNKNVKKTSKDPTSRDVASTLTVKSERKSLREEMKAGIDLYFSDKKEEDMTPEEKVLFAKVQRFMEDD